MIFENVLTDLDPPEIAGVLSSLVCQDKGDHEHGDLRSRLSNAKKRVLDLAYVLGELQADCGVPTGGEMYRDQLNFALVEVAYEWAKGTVFTVVLSSVPSPRMLANKYFEK